MANEGFLIKFDGKETIPCYAVAFDYDKWEYTINDKETRQLPKPLKSITVEVEYK